MKNFWIVLLTLLAGCQGARREIDARGEFFAGKFVFYGGEASLADCATGVELPVSDDANYKSLERAYLKLAPAPGEAIYAELRGALAQQPRLKGEGMETVIEVDSVIRIDRSNACVQTWLIAGIYEAKTKTGRQLLRLSPDYTFTETTFPIGKDKDITRTGIWWRSAELEVVLEETAPGSALESFQVIPPQETLSRNSGGEPLAYKKVYL